MKKQINDLLLKMQTGENCIGETANKILDLYSVGQQRELLNFYIKFSDEELMMTEKQKDEYLNKCIEKFNYGQHKK